MDHVPFAFCRRYEASRADLVKRLVKMGKISKQALKEKKQKPPSMGGADDSGTGLGTGLGTVAPHGHPHPVPSIHPDTARLCGAFAALARAVAQVTASVCRPAHTDTYTQPAPAHTGTATHAYQPEALAALSSALGDVDKALEAVCNTALAAALATATAAAPSTTVVGATGDDRSRQAGTILDSIPADDDDAGPAVLPSDLATGLAGMHSTLTSAAQDLLDCYGRQGIFVSQYFIYIYIYIYIYIWRALPHFFFMGSWFSVQFFHTRIAKC